MKLRYAQQPDERVNAAPLTVEEYPWSPPIVLPAFSDAITQGQLLAPLTYAADPAEYVTPAALKLEEYPWERPWVLPDRSDAFCALIGQFTYSPDAMDEVPGSSFGGPEYSDWEWKPPTVLPTTIQVQALWSYGDGDDSPNSLLVEDFPWDPMPMRPVSIRSTLFAEQEEFPNFLRVTDDYQWWVNPAALPQSAQPFMQEEVWGIGPLRIEDAYDAQVFTPPRMIHRTVPFYRMAAQFTLEDDSSTWPTPPVATSGQHVIGDGLVFYVTGL